jgi:polyisoprenoid-binding protein YceI
LTLSGTQVTAATFEVDMATVTSDENRRDNQFRGRLLDTDNFPTATFALTAPIELGGVPADATPVTATATGDLTLKGTTNPVTLDVQAQKDGESIQVVGNTDVVFADYGIEDPSTSGISTQDHGLLEFDLRFVPA